MRRRPTLLAALLLAGLSLLFVSPALLPGKVLSNSDSFWFKAPWAAGKPASLERVANPEFDDAPSQMHPFARYASGNLPDVPLWNPHISSGRPFLADMQSAIFSPFQIPTYLFGFWSALALIAALKLWVASFGAFLLARSAGIGLGGSLAGGIVYGFNLWLVCWLSYPHASVWALVPWLALLAGRMAQRPTRRTGVALAVVVGAAFTSGHPETSFHAIGVACVAAFGWGLLVRRREGRPLRPALLAFAASLAAGGALAALVLAPFLELLVNSADIRQRSGTAKDAKLPLKYLLGAFLPGQWGKPTQTPLDLFLLARAVYIGALPLMLIAAALLLRPTRARLAIAGAGAACLMVVFGIPPVFDLVVLVPPFSSGHNTRLIALAMLCAALLAAYGLDDLLERRGTARLRGAVLGAGGVLFVLPIAYIVLRGRTSFDALPAALDAALDLADPSASGTASVGAIVRGAGLLIWIAVGAAALAILAVAVRGTRRPAVLAGVALALMFADLARAGMGYNPAIDRELAEQPATPAIRLLERASPERFVSTGDIPQNTISMTHGLFDASGYDLPVERRYDTFWRSRLSPEFPSQTGYLAGIPLSLPKVDAERVRTLRLLGVRHILQPPTDPPLRVPGLELVHPGPDARVYRLAETNPRAVVVGAQVAARDDEAALAALTGRAFDAQRAAVVEETLRGVPAVAEGSVPPPPAGRATVRPTEEADAVEVGVSAERAGLLVLSDAYAPGWKAEVDGRPAKVERVNYVMRGVRVPAGTSDVRFTYEPLSWRIGWIVSLLTLLGLAAVALWPARHRSAPGAPPAAAPEG
ncbi:MAG: hypothetical protein AVDCRST_MAG30-1992 [uncultured Solirubrobacteraceae bacterium]|uniref:YfhO family protein n=1 Tax=uncultured Solirubrobacteraceae bacterium TaxID=1162706 RepID=A0A6J4SQQ5_9ACTN|nr:MAG: hypothetical protein AVDCRST_MAG30-1992 [uncultured Solirubrobacteraceae bacterium]